MAVGRRTVLTGFAALGVAACDPMPAEPPPAFAALNDRYWELQNAMFPGARTPEDGLPAHGGAYDGVARLGYFADGGDFTGRVNAEMTVLIDFISDRISSGQVTGVVTADGRSWPGELRLRRNAITGNSFATIVRGQLMLDGEAAQFRGRINGSIYGPEGRYAFGNIGFAGPDLAPRLAGTFSLGRRGIT